MSEEPWHLARSPPEAFLFSPPADADLLQGATGGTEGTAHPLNYGMPLLDSFDNTALEKAIIQGFGRMDMLRAMRVFAAVADGQGFAEAGRKLGLSPPAVTRIVGELEAHLAVRLLTRTTRVIRLTEAGARFLADSRRILASVTEAEDATRGLYSEPRGHISITAPVQFGRMFTIDLLIEFLRRYPGTEISTLFVDRVVHLSEEGFDVAVRIGPLPDSSLRAIRVGTVRRVVCGAPAYLKARGLPQTPDDLAMHDVVGVTSLDAGLDWKFAGAQGSFTRRVSPRLFVNTDDAGIAAAVAGFGLSQVFSYKIAPQLDDGRLEIVLSDHEPAPVPVHVIHQEGDRPSARIRALVDHLVDRLRANTAINEAADAPATMRTLPTSGADRLA